MAEQGGMFGPHGVPGGAAPSKLDEHAQEPLVAGGKTVCNFEISDVVGEQMSVSRVFPFFISCYFIFLPNECPGMSTLGILFLRFLN